MRVLQVGEHVPLSTGEFLELDVFGTWPSTDFFMKGEKRTSVPWQSNFRGLFHFFFQITRHIFEVSLTIYSNLSCLRSIHYDGNLPRINFSGHHSRIGVQSCDDFVEKRGHLKVGGVLHSGSQVFAQEAWKADEGLNSWPHLIQAGDNFFHCSHPYGSNLGPFPSLR